jgi:hypothetical protein
VVLTPGNAVLQLGEGYTLTVTLTDQFLAAIDATVTFVWTKTEGDASLSADRTTTLLTSGGQAADSQALAKWAAVDITVTVAGYSGTIPPVQVYWALQTGNLQYPLAPEPSTALKTYGGIHAGLDGRGFVVRPEEYTHGSVGSGTYSNTSEVVVTCAWPFSAALPVYLYFEGPLSDGVPNWVYDLSGDMPL